MVELVFKNTHIHSKSLLFYSMLLYCQSSDQPFRAACAVLHSSV